MSLCACGTISTVSGTFSTVSGSISPYGVQTATIATNVTEGTLTTAF